MAHITTTSANDDDGNAVTVYQVNAAGGSVFTTDQQEAERTAAEWSEMGH